MSKRKIIGASAAALALIAIYFLFGSKGSKNDSLVVVPVEKGEFVISVTTTGELEAKNSLKIYGPNTSKLRVAGIWQLKIEDIIPDGTIVDSGAYVARLDASELGNKINEQEIDLEKQNSQFIKTQLDTTLDLRTARNELVNQKFELEQKQITVDQSIYEPPATRRQAKIDLEKAERTYDQSVKNYKIKYNKACAEMTDMHATLKKAENALNNSKSLLQEFNVFAPQSGMVIYSRGWDGKKKGVGAVVSTWENVIATLPDLSKMMTKTYVNEIDISKITEGQKVEIGIDAFPDKKLSGKVTAVANIGEQLNGSTAKVFEVMIEVHESDTTLRPAMTTKTSIITDIIPESKFIPLDAIYFQDSATFVYTKDGDKQEVITGKANDDYITILEGIEEGEKIYIRPPEGANKWDLVELPEAIRIKAHKKEQERVSQLRKKNNATQISMQNNPSQN